MTISDHLKRIANEAAFTRWTDKSLVQFAAALLAPMAEASRPPVSGDALREALAELIRVSKSAGMNAASDFGYLPSAQAADEEEISEAVQAVYAAATPPERSGLPDVKRLRMAYGNVEAADPLTWLNDGDFVDALAVEYARLSSGGEDTPA